MVIFCIVLIFVLIFMTFGRYLLDRWSKITLETCFTTEFGEITQNKGHCAVRGHSRSPILVPIESIYDFLLVISTNLPPILHHFLEIAFDRSKIAIIGYRSCVWLPRRRGSPGAIYAKFLINVNEWPRYQKARNDAENFNRLSRAYERYRPQTDDRQTGKSIQRTWTWLHVR